MIYTKCIFYPIELSDGIRISVMGRHTLNDGKTLDPRITAICYHEWLKELAPPDKLMGDYSKENLLWVLFEYKYLEYLRSEPINEKIKLLANRSTNFNLTLLSIEEKPEKSHRRLLAEECQKYNKYLEIIHR